MTKGTDVANTKIGQQPGQKKTPKLQQSLLPRNSRRLSHQTAYPIPQRCQAAIVLFYANRQNLFRGGDRLVIFQHQIRFGLTGDHVSIDNNLGNVVHRG